jgi:acyl dehydratase
MKNAAMTESLIPPETMNLVGQRLAEPVTVRIDAREAQRYACAVGDLNPVYFDEEAALSAGYRTLAVPPTFVSHAPVAPRPMEELRPDGLYQGSDRLRLRVDRIMFGGEEWDFLEPVCVGDDITSEVRLAALDEKTGSKGPFVRTVRETTYTNQDDVVVARSRQIGIAR